MLVTALATADAHDSLSERFRTACEVLARPVPRRAHRHGDDQSRQARSPLTAALVVDQAADA